MEVEARDRCAHELCDCRVAQRARFCSGYCANVGCEEDDPKGAACACGHAACEIAREGSHVDDEITIAMGRDPGPSALTH